MLAINMKHFKWYPNLFSLFSTFAHYTFFSHM